MSLRRVVSLIAGTLVASSPSPAVADSPFRALRKSAAIGQLEPTVAVGPSHIVQVGNWRLHCYDRGGNLLWTAKTHPNEDPFASGPYFWDGFAGKGGVDPRVIYDRFSGRLVLINMGRNEPQLYLAISRDGTPDGTDSTHWDKYTIPLTNNQFGLFHWPGLGVNSERIWVTGWLQQPIQGTDEPNVALGLRRPPGLPNPPDPTFYTQPGNKLEFLLPNGESGPQTQYRLPMPTHFFGTLGQDTMYFCRWWRNPPNQDAEFHVISATVDAGGNLSVVTQTLTGGPAPVDAPLDCPGGAQACSRCVTLPFYNVQNAVWRDGTIHFVRECSTSDAYGTRYTPCWYTIATNGWPHSGSIPTLTCTRVDAGRVFVSDDAAQDQAIHLRFPLVMPTANGDVSLFVHRVFKGGYVDLCCLGRRTFDAATRFGAGITVVRAGSAVVESDRWGEYQGIALDPLDANRVWVTGELGRCFADAECADCSPCTGSSTLKTQSCFHSAIGSYVISQQPVRLLTIGHQGSEGPGTVLVKIMPMDVDGFADVTLSSGIQAGRNFAHGAAVTLRAQDLLQANPLWKFVGWRVDGQLIVPPTGSNPRVLGLVMLTGHNVVPVHDNDQ